MRFFANIFISLALLFNYSAKADTNYCQLHQCIAVVDAGSTGSRVHIYAYDKEGTGFPRNIVEVWSHKIQPGLATIEAKKVFIDSYLDSLFANAPQSSMPVYFYATAGMRLASPDRQQQIYGLLRDWFETNFQWQLLAAKTITGRDEGLFAWLAVNYQLGVLNKNPSRLVGVMDMGGASVQVIFPIENPAKVKSDSIYPLKLNNRTYYLFIHSFLGLGQTEVLRQFTDSKACFSKEYRLPIGQSAEGDAFSCENNIATLMNKVHHVNCIVKPVLKANSIPKWFALGGLASLAQSKPFRIEDRLLTNQVILEQANSQICQQSWTNLTAQYPDENNLYGYCFLPAYYYALMVEGYGLQPQEIIHHLENKSNDWTLGVILTL